ncbi:MAG: ParA family protein [Rhodobacteraceae bacterium]|nr:ParA family protein [Paracoccaceae bacterium]
MRAEESGRPRIVAVSNQKGGVGKTTSVVNLGASLAEMGVPTLIIDLDPQGNASTGLGFDPAERSASIHDVLSGGKPLAECLLETATEDLKLVPASPMMSSADIEMAKSERRLWFLADALAGEGNGTEALQYILIDCPPSLGLLTLNALAAADSVLVPLQAEFFALEGLSQLILTIREVRKTANEALAIEGVLLTMFDRRNNLSRQVERDAREHLRDLVFETVIPRNVKLGEAPSHGIPAVQYDRNSAGSVAYRELANEVLRRRP